jgi:hypothetical protein
MELFAKVAFESARAAKFFAANHVLRIMRNKVTEYELKDIPFVVNPVADTALRKAVDFKYGGMHVVVAPKGSGKTSQLRGVINNHIHNGGAAKYFGSELSHPNEFYIAFGDAARRMDLFEIMPKRSVIVIDQLEHFRELPREMETLLLHLALESSRTAECNVIIMLSDIKMAQIVLNLNGNHKINQAGKAADFQWSEREVRRFVELGCPTWNDCDKEALVKLGLLAMAPAFLQGVLSLCNDGLPADISAFEGAALRFGKSFEDFSNAGL